jgi:hypothetical protein
MFSCKGNNQQSIKTRNGGVASPEHPDKKIIV